MNIIVLLGKSGSGKDAMQNLLINYLNDFEIVKLTSTRPMRENEKQGNPYFFTTKEDFLNNLNNFIEYRKYKTLLNNVKDYWYYGINKHSLEEGKNYILINTIEGLNKIKEYFPNANIISFYLEVSDIVRTERAKSRGGFEEVEWNRRLEEDNNDFKNVLGEVDFIINNEEENLNLTFEKIKLILIKKSISS